MTTLCVKFPGTWPGWHVEELFLHRSPSSGSCSSNYPSKTITVVSVDSEPHSDYNSDCPVFRAAVVDGSDKSTATAVALKFAMREDFIDDLDKEARLYAGALQPLQGTVIPRCYGLYTGAGEEGQSIACLVLEHCGECIQQPFQYLPLSVRYEAVGFPVTFVDHPLKGSVFLSGWPTFIVVDYATVMYKSNPFAYHIIRT